MQMKAKQDSARLSRAQRRAIRKAAHLSPSGQQLTAVYALGIRDGLQIAADIHNKTRQTEEDAS